MVGQRIRKRRLQLGLTLRDLADGVGVTPSFLSYVERDIVSPSLSSLVRIAQELQVPLVYFFLEGRTTSSVVRPAERPVLRLADSNVSYELLSQYPGRRLACMLAHLQPGTSSFDAPQQHEQEECVLVLSGTLEAQLGSETFVLNEGDSVHYDGMVPHRFTSIGDEVTVYLVVISPLVV